MASSINDVLGQLGAAKIFSRSVSNTLNTTVTENDNKITDLEKQISSATSEKQKEFLNRKLKRLKRQNKIEKFQSKATEGATDFLLKIAEYCDIGKEAIIEWLSEFLVSALPALEIAVKTLLITNLKKLISCSIDPRIPDKWRTDGVYVNESAIDPRKILYTSPYSKYGRDNYFGVYYDNDYTDSVPLYSLAKAEDMNAFLWFTKNCANFVSPNVIGDGGIVNFFDECQSGDTLYNKHYFVGKDAYKFLPGSIFKMSIDANTIFLCTDSFETSTKTKYTIVPVTNSWTSVNWYKNNDNPDKEKGIFNLEYSNEYRMSEAIPKNNFCFKILPKPFRIASGVLTELGNAVTTMGDKADSGDLEAIVGLSGLSSSDISTVKFPGIKSFVPPTARFNGNGIADSKGKYSIDETRFTVIQRHSNVSHVTTYELNSKTVGSDAFISYNSSTRKFFLSKNHPATGSTLNIVPLSQTELSEVLSECYFGRTVFEFNFDYVMSFKLFDAHVISASIINALCNISIPKLNLRFKKKKKGSSDAVSDTDQAYIDNYVDKLVEKIISQEDTEFTDCFYTFSNEEYNEMEDATNANVVNGVEMDGDDSSVSEIYNTLNAYNADASLYEQKETLTNTFTKLSEVVDEDTDNSDGTGYDDDEANSSGSKSSNGFIKKLIKALTSALVNSLLTPKVIMLIQINQKLLEGNPLDLQENYTFSVQDVLNGMEGLITSVVKQIIDMIQKELLRIVMSYISKILNAYVHQLIMEYAKKWVDLLRQLLMCFKLNKNKLKSNNDDDGDSVGNAINSALDKVDYADIDELVDEIMPNTNPC